MKIFKNEDELLPTIITDLSGKILYLNELAKTELCSVAVGDSVLKFIRRDVIKKMSMYGRMDIVAPENCDYERAIVKAVGEGITKTLVVVFFHAENENMENDERLFSGYDKIINVKQQGAISLNELIKQIVDCMKEDLRFSYKDFEIIKAENDRVLYAHLAHLCTVAIGIISVFNEIDYKASIKIGMEKHMDDYLLRLSLCKINLEAINSPRELSILYPNIASRLEYLTNLCKHCNVKYRFSSNPNEIVAEFIVTNIVNEESRLAQAPIAALAQELIAYAMSVFIYDAPNDTVKEEQE